MPARRVTDHPLSNAERQARRAAQHRAWRTALAAIRDTATTLEEARDIAVKAIGRDTAYLSEIFGPPKSSVQEVYATEARARRAAKRIGLRLKKYIAIGGGRCDENSCGAERINCFALYNREGTIVKEFWNSDAIILWCRAQTSAVAPGSKPRALPPALGADDRGTSALPA